MRRRQALCLALLAAALPASVLAAPSTATTKSVVLHVTTQFKARPAFAHAMASATLRYTKGDVFIRLTTDNLPSPRTLGKAVYALYASDGGMTDKVGVLHVSGNMAGVSGQVMMNKIQYLYVYAQSAASVKRAAGTQVLSAMVG